jgi:hypothetical protein
MLQDSVWGSRLHSFCIGLPGSPDLKAAREVAQFLGTDHHELTFTVQVGELQEEVHSRRFWQCSNSTCCLNRLSGDLPVGLFAVALWVSRTVLKFLSTTQ